MTFSPVDAPLNRAWILNLNSQINLISFSLYLHPTDNHELLKLVFELKNGNAPGFDGCTPILIKEIVEKVISPFTHMCDLSLSSGMFPDEWKLASVTPVHKGANRRLPSNFRPISLLSIFQNCWKNWSINA